jgi:DNA-binding beta-propeller fold protein YncE
LLAVLLPAVVLSQTVDTVLRLPGRPQNVTYVPEGNKLYAKVEYNDSANGDAAWLYVFDCQTHSVRRVYDLGENGGIDGGVWSWRRNRFYYGALAEGGGDIAVIDNATDSLIKWIRPYDSFRPAYDSRDDKLYCTSLTNVAVVDCSTDSVIKVIGAPFQLWGFACWDSVNDRVFVGSAWGDKVVAIDCPTDSVVAVISTGLEDPGAAAIYPERGEVYVSGFWAGGIAVIDLSTLTLLRRIDCVLSLGAWVLPVTVNAQEDKVYLPVWGCWDSFPNYGDTLKVLDKYDSAVKCLPTLGYIYEMALTPSGDRLYVVSNHPDGSGNRLLILDCHSDSFIASCRFGTFSTDIAYNTSSHEIYVADINDSAIYVLRDTTPSAIVERARVSPGTFSFSVSPNVIRPDRPLQVTIEAGGVMLGQVAALKLFDCAGRLVAQQKVVLDQPRIVLSWTPSEAPLASGVYVLTANAGQVRRKVVVQ